MRITLARGEQVVIEFCDGCEKPLEESIMVIFDCDSKLVVMNRKGTVYNADLNPGNRLDDITCLNCGFVITAGDTCSNCNESFQSLHDDNSY